MLKGVVAPIHNYQVHPPMSGGSDRGVFTLASQRHAIHVGDWRIDLKHLWHRHPGEGWSREERALEYAVSDRECWKCQAICPDEIWFAHRLQQLP